MEELKLKGVTLVYGPAGAGKTTFAAWYAYNNYRRTLWVSAFEDEPTFRANMAKLGYAFGDRLVYWEAPLVEDLEAFSRSLIEVAFQQKPDLLVLDSITELTYGDHPDGGVKVLHNLIYKLIKTAGMDVLATAERQVAERIMYIADNVIELRYDVYPYGTVRELVVRKIRGGRAGYALPFAITEGLGFVLIKAAPLSRPGEAIKTGVPCIDETLGGVMKGAVTALVGPIGSGKSSIMLKTAESLKRAERSVYYLSFLGDADILKGKYNVEVLNAPLDVEAFLLQVYTLAVKHKADALFVDGLDILARFFGEKVFYTVLLEFIKLVKAMGIAAVISLAEEWGLLNYLDIVARVHSRTVTAIKTPIYAAGSQRSCD